MTIDGAVYEVGPAIRFWGCRKCGSVNEWHDDWLPGATPFCWCCFAPMGYGARDNGIYTITSVGTASAPWVMKREGDSDE